MRVCDLDLTGETKPVAWDFYKLGRELELPYNCEEIEGDDRFQVKEVNTWMCTDTLVGLFAYFLDGQFVCLRYQPYRKSDSMFIWASQEAAEMTRDYISSFVRQPRLILVVGLDTEIPDTWLIPWDRKKF